MFDVDAIRKTHKKMTNYLYKTVNICIFLVNVGLCCSSVGALLFSSYWIAGLKRITSLLLGAKQENQQDLENFLSNLIFYPVSYMVLQCLLLAHSFFSCCASCCGYRTMLRFLCGILVFITSYIAIILVLSVMTLRELKRIEDSFTIALMYNFVRYFSHLHADSQITKSATFTFGMNAFQQSEKCCGVNSYKDYEYATLWREGAGTHVVARTCCKIKQYQYLSTRLMEQKVNKCAEFPTAENSFIDNGCGDELLNYVRESISANSLMTTGTLMAVLLLTVALLACRIVLLNKQKRLRDLWRPVPEIEVQLAM